MTFNPNTPINFITNQFNPNDGYGHYAIETVEHLIQAGRKVTPLQYPSLVYDFDNMPANLRAFTSYRWDGITVQCLPADAFLPYHGRQWGLTMWEDDSIPRPWVGFINGMERVIVPCEFYADVFKHEGVKVPIHVIHGGTNTEKFLPLPPRPDDGLFNILVLGDRAQRKGLEVVLNALRTPYWLGKQDVRLWVKTRPQAGNNDYKTVRFIEPRLRLWSEDVAHMSEVFKHMDVYAYDSYGDGWGLSPRQAVACGLPTIAPRHTGVQVGIDDWATVILETFSRPLSSYAHDQSRWFKPDAQETADALQWVYEHQQEARCKALHGRQWLIDNQHWRHSAQAWGCLFEKYG